MAQRQLAKREVTNVAIPQDRSAEGLASLADTALGFAELQKRKDLANINNHLADANLQMFEVTNKWRLANESDPTNQEALGKLHAEYDRILGQYNDKVGLLSRGDWIKFSSRLKNQYQLDNAEWGIKQTTVNTENKINGSMQKNFSIFAQLGRNDDLNNFKQTYQNSKSAIEEFSQGFIGEERRNKLMEDYASDSMTSWLLGLAEKNPKKALAYLEQKDVRNDLGSQKKVFSIKRIISGMTTVQERQIEDNKVQNRFNIIADIAERGFDWQNSTALTNKIGSQDPELAEAIIKNLEKGGYQPEEDASGEIKNKAFMDLAKDIFNSKDPKTISDFLVNTLSDNKNISRDRLAILVYAAKEHAGELKKANSGPGFWESAFNFILQSNPITAPFVLFNTFKRAKAENVQGEQVLNIAKDEIDKELKKINPKYTIEDVEYTAAETGMTIPQVLEALRAKEGRK